MDRTEELRHKYNPEGSKLRHDQKELFRMLLYVDKICKANNISYWLSSGTLLGAARHKGFIPWDDDMDIVLLKKDAERLEKILIELQDEEFVYHCIHTDYNYVNIFGKFRKRHGSIISSNPRYKYYKWRGIGFDIFAIEEINLWCSLIGSWVYSRSMRLTDYISNMHIRRFSIRTMQFLNFHVLFPLLRLLGRINRNREYHYVLGTGWSRHTFYMKDTFPLTTAEFEGVQMPVPCDRDTYLQNVYGDWRKVPAEEEIKKSIHCQEYRDEIFGA